ncbi:hypothetical protein LSH36_340g02028 [Paralvinella palmiformis]|uniref:Plasminogen receptor (KT) n=1 Tax=Paralvinella palmiformis TaxID=53620 RepID=A0AAD9JF94_9ANNE|nr:hypothetical protein LSH36_340g02028 [Paralvinella palmiformis]
MGLLMGKALDENMKKQQQFMLQNQRDAIERQIQMQNYMREQATAMQLATARERFNWWASFYTLALIASVTGYRLTKRPMPLVPMLPLTFVFGYQADLCYGNKMERIKKDALRILEEDPDLITLPQGLPTVSLLEERRQKMK